MSKVAISGSSGFIGSRLTEVLSSKKYQVIKITQERLYSPIDLKELFDKEQPEYIFHLAAYGNMSHQKDINMTVFANLIGTYNMLQASNDIPYKAFVNFGSSSEYGKKGKAMSEKDICLPETFYGASKLGATALTYAFARQNDKPILTVRPFSVYGPGEADFRFIPTVCRAMLNQETFTLDEKANHDWIYIDDFIDGLLLAIEHIKAIPTRTVNIGTGRMHTNKEVCEALKRATGLSYTATSYGGMRVNDSDVWMADMSLLTSLGFYPKYMLQEGLKKTFAYYKEKYAQ